VHENGFFFTEEEIGKLAIILMEDAGCKFSAFPDPSLPSTSRSPPRNNGLDFDQFKNLFNEDKRPGLMESVARSVDRCLLPKIVKQDKSVKRSSHDPFRKFRLVYIRKHMTSFIFLIVFMVITCSLCGMRFYQYSPLIIRKIGKFVLSDQSTIWAQIARSGGICLNFTCSIILFCVCRKTITFLRCYGLGMILPLDQNIYFHKMIGYAIASFACVHTIGHGFNYWRMSRLSPGSGGLPEGKSFVTQYFGIQPRGLKYDDWFSGGNDWLLRGYCQVFGWALVLILLVMILTSLPIVRRKSHFEVFYFSHLLYFPFYVILLMHAIKFWIWFIAPGCLFMIELLIRTIRAYTGSQGKSCVISGVIHESPNSNVVHLIIQKPPLFNFNPGDWVFVRIPSIALMEWHPFTISSAPEHPGEIWLHIRKDGEWTSRIYDYFKKIDEEKRRQEEEELQQQNRRPSGSRSVRSLSFKSVSSRFRALKQGKPYSSMTTDSESAETGFVTARDAPSTSSVSNGTAISMNNLPGTSGSATGVRAKIRQQQAAGASRGISRNSSFRAPFDVNNSRAYVLPVLEQDQISNSGSFMEKFRTPARNPVITRIKMLYDAENKLPGTSSTSLPEEAVNSGKVTAVDKPMVIHIDGPYGSPTTTLFQTEHAVLIGAGIGVTPFASILQSIMYRYRDSRQTCPHCETEFSAPIPSNVMKLKKVDFVWVNKDQKSFKWMISLLSELELEQVKLKSEERFLDIHIYITSAIDQSDMKAVGLKLALDLMHEKEERDLITGLKSRSRAGRPNWKEFFDKIESQNKGDITVFFCGTPAMGREIQSECLHRDRKIRFKKETF
jgi:predicted ferric reductase